MVIGLYALRDQEAGALGHAVEPEYYVWAWRREEDLSFIDPSRVKVALWTATINLDRDAFIVEHRTNKVTYPTDAEVAGVIRLEATEVPDDATVPHLANAIIDASRPFRPVEHQVDFDARLSQRAFYRHLLEELRVRTGGVRLSITALASWCSHDDWTEGLPVDAVVPMIYRMGRDGDTIRHTLHAEREFPNPICAGNIGYSADEPLGTGRRPAPGVPVPSRAVVGNPIHHARPTGGGTAMNRRLGIALTILAVARSAFASGPEPYVTPFVYRIDLGDVMAGDFPDQLRFDDVVFALIVYLHLSGRFTGHHAAPAGGTRARLAVAGTTRPALPNRRRLLLQRSVSRSRFSIR